jgi:chromosome segregation ATPase
VDLYIRITTLFQEWQRALAEQNSTRIKLASVTEEITASTAEMKDLDTEIKALTAQIETLQEPGIPSAITAERDKVVSKVEQLSLEQDKLTARSTRLTADGEGQIARILDIGRSLNDQRWALEILGSEKVRSLADMVLDEIMEAANVLIKSGKSVEFDYSNWGQLNNAMRKELQILD